MLKGANLGGAGGAFAPPVFFGLIVSKFWSLEDW